VTELFPATTLRAAFRGSISVQSSTPVSIIGFQFLGAQFSTLPVPVSNPAAVPAHGPVGGPNAAMFPHFVMSGGWATALDLLNNTSSPMTGRVDVFDPSGNPLAVQWNGRSQSVLFIPFPQWHGELVAPGYERAVSFPKAARGISRKRHKRHRKILLCFLWLISQLFFPCGGN
jgi:hypothetical protein